MHNWSLFLARQTFPSAQNKVYKLFKMCWSVYLVYMVMVVVGKSLSNTWVSHEVYLLLSLVWTCVLTHREYRGGSVCDTRHHF